MLSSSYLKVGSVLGHPVYETKLTCLLDMKKLKHCIKVMNRSEQRFFIDTIF